MNESNLDITQRLQLLTNRPGKRQNIPVDIEPGKAKPVWDVATRFSRLAVLEFSAVGQEPTDNYVATWSKQAIEALWRNEGNSDIADLPPRPTQVPYAMRAVGVAFETTAVGTSAIPHVSILADVGGGVGPIGLFGDRLPNNDTVSANPGWYSFNNCCVYVPLRGRTDYVVAGESISFEALVTDQVDLLGLSVIVRFSTADVEVDKILLYLICDY